MNAPNVPTNYIRSVQPETAAEPRLDKAYVTSVRGILKFACLVMSRMFSLTMESFLFSPSIV